MVPRTGRQRAVDGHQPLLLHRRPSPAALLRDTSQGGLVPYRNRQLHLRDPASGGPGGTAVHGVRQRTRRRNPPPGRSSGPLRHRLELGLLGGPDQRPPRDARPDDQQARPRQCRDPSRTRHSAGNGRLPGPGRQRLWRPERHQVRSRRGDRRGAARPLGPRTSGSWRTGCCSSTRGPPGFPRPSRSSWFPISAPRASIYERMHDMVDPGAKLLRMRRPGVLRPAPERGLAAQAPAVGRRHDEQHRRCLFGRPVRWRARRQAAGRRWRRLHGVHRTPGEAGGREGGAVPPSSRAGRNRLHRDRRSSTARPKHCLNPDSRRVFTWKPFRRPSTRSG